MLEYVTIMIPLGIKSFFEKIVHDIGSINIKVHVV